MTTTHKSPLAVALIGAFILFALAACDSDSTTAPADPGPGPDPGPVHLPPIPEPSNLSEIVPTYSDTLNVGLSDPLMAFAPFASSVTRIDESLSEYTSDWFGRQVELVCDGRKSWNSGRADVGGSYVDEAPRLLHRRYWQKLRQQILGPGTTFEQSEEISWGKSTTNETAREFSTTIGVSVEVGTGDWSPLDVSVTGSFEQTSTVTEVRSVTIETGGSRTETYSVTAPDNEDVVWVLWQLVDEFVVVDADTIPIADSPTLRYVAIEPVPVASWPNKDVVRQGVTKFPR